MIHLTTAAVDGFLARHSLPPSYRESIADHYLPLARWLAGRVPADARFLLGINGAQGSGKSTLAELLALALAEAGIGTAVLSLDDFYLTHAERGRLAADVHPLLATRGVPGTHDLGLLRRCLDRLESLGRGQTLAVPRFDKAADDRAPRAGWGVVEGPIALVVLEGWCVGSPPLSGAAGDAPMNALERDHDAAGAWRLRLSEQLAGPYARLWRELDALVHLQVPDFDCVFRWRLEQEQKLAAATGGEGAHLMSADAVARFIQHFERVTRNDLDLLPGVADVVIRLREDHGCAASRYRESL